MPASSKPTPFVVLVVCGARGGGRSTHTSRVFSSVSCETAHTSGPAHLSTCAPLLRGVCVCVCMCVGATSAHRMRVGAVKTSGLRRLGLNGRPGVDRALAPCWYTLILRVCTLGCCAIFAQNTHLHSLLPIRCPPGSMQEQSHGRHAGLGFREAEGVRQQPLN